MDKTKLKIKLYEACLNAIGQRIQTAQTAMQSAEESRNNETKSSVGDKYETGRAMMQNERERNKVQLINAMQLKQALQQIDPGKKYDKVQVGSLLKTNQGYYFVAIGLGKIALENETFYVISPKAPLGIYFMNLVVGSKTVFQNREYIIEEIC